jgi:hypothetical protein
VQQQPEIGHDEADGAAQHLRRAGRQVELADAHIGPHVVDARHQVRVARQAQRRDVEGGRLGLVGHAQVDVLQLHRIAEGFRRAVPGAFDLGHAVHVLGPPLSRLFCRKARMRGGGA